MIGEPEGVTNRPNPIDPFLDLIRLIRPHATSWGAIRASGRWALSFRAREDLLFFRVDTGRCQLLRRGQDALEMERGDFLVIRTSIPFVLASDATTKPIDSETLVAKNRSTEMRLGGGSAGPVVIRGGKFAFDTVNEDLLLDLMPSLVRVGANDTGSARMRALLAMNEDENLNPGPGSEFVITRLMELLFVEMLRGEAPRARPAQDGLLRGLADPVISRALRAMHGDIARPWTAQELARLSGCSHSTFKERFATVVGVSPIRYLQRWRMAIAKDELHKGERTVAEIAALVGFQSGRAFSTAFARAVGGAPSSFRALQKRT